MTHRHRNPAQFYRKLGFRTLNFKIRAPECRDAFIVTGAVSIKLDRMSMFLISADINDRLCCCPHFRLFLLLLLFWRKSLQMVASVLSQHL